MFFDRICCFLFFYLMHLSNGRARDVWRVWLDKRKIVELLRIRDFNLGNCRLCVIWKCILGRESRRVMCTLMHFTSFADWFLARPLLPDVAGQTGGRETLRGSIWVISVFPPFSSPFFFAFELPFLRHGRCTPVPLSHRSLLFAAGARPGNSSAYLLPALIQLLISTRCLLFSYIFLVALLCRDEWCKIL